MNPKVLNIIRYALLAGVLFFGAVAWFLTRDGGLVALDPPALMWVRYGIAAVLVGAAVGVMAVRRQWKNRAAFSEKASLNLVGWAVAEGAAFAGAIYYLMTGNILLFLLGLVLMLATEFVLLPIPSEQS